MNISPAKVYIMWKYLFFLFIANFRVHQVLVVSK